jgi:Dolichyl-phosphate-mannose-protein mannosyltransferase
MRLLFQRLSTRFQFSLAPLPVYELAIALLCGISFCLGWLESLYNMDSHHWGVMYGQALHLNRGQVPHRDMFIMYGVLTTWIQALSLRLWGPQLISLGLCTSVFHAANLALTYGIFRQFLSKSVAFSGVLIVFLLHGYAKFPWSNYYSYTFVLIAVLLLLKPLRAGAIATGMAAGFAVAGACLCRYSALVAILPPFGLYFLYCFAIGRVAAPQRPLPLSPAFRQLCGFGLGVAIPLGAFGLFLSSQGAWPQFLCQNNAMYVSSSFFATPATALPRLIDQLFSLDTLLGRDSRINFFSLLAAGNVLAIALMLYERIKAWRQVQRQAKLGAKLDLTRPPQADLNRSGWPISSQQVDATVILLSSVSLFGYLNALHLYDVFRLANASSLAVGVVLYLGSQLGLSARWGRLIGAAILSGFCLFWGSSMWGVMTSSNYFPWQIAEATAEIQDIPVLRGKRVPPTYHQFYQSVQATLKRYPSNYVLVNQTLDPIFTFLSDRPSVQSLSFYLNPLDDCEQDRQFKIQRAIAEKNGIFLIKATTTLDEISQATLEKNGYQLAQRIKWPDTIPWIGVYPDNVLAGKNSKPILLNQFLHVLVPKTPG